MTTYFFEGTRKIMAPIIVHADTSEEAEKIAMKALAAGNDEWDDGEPEIEESVWLYDIEGDAKKNEIRTAISALYKNGESKTYDEVALVLRAKRAYCKGHPELPYPSASSFVWEEPGARVFIDLVNCKGLLARYRWYPNQDKLRRIKASEVEAR